MCAVNLRGKNVRSCYISEKLKSSKRKEATFYRQWSAYNWTGSFTCKDIEVCNHDSMLLTRKKEEKGYCSTMS